MATRTRRKTVAFGRPFLVKGIDRVLPPGNYVVVTEEELVKGLSFPVYRRVSTTMMVPAQNRPSSVEINKTGHSIMAGHLIGALWGKAAGCHRGRDGGMGYGLHLTGVTSSGVPFLELIQPVAVRRHGHWSVYGAPRPSVTCNAMSSSPGALSIGIQPEFTRDARIALFFPSPLDLPHGSRSPSARCSWWPFIIF
jgi:hypothetical protein